MEWTSVQGRGRAAGRVQVSAAVPCARRYVPRSRRRVGVADTHGVNAVRAVVDRYCSARDVDPPARLQPLLLLGMLPTYVAVEQETPAARLSVRPSVGPGSPGCARSIRACSCPPPHNALTVCRCTAWLGRSGRHVCVLPFHLPSLPLLLMLHGAHPSCRHGCRCRHMSTIHAGTGHLKHETSVLVLGQKGRNVRWSRRQ